MIQKRPLSSEPTVAVIIPCKNEVRHIARCLDSILASGYRRELLRVIVVDGLSVDGTREILREYCARHPFISILDNPGANKPVGLNLAIKSVDAEIIIRMDAHAEYPDTYISDLVSGLIKYDVENIGGIQAVPEEREPIPEAICLSLSHWFGVGNAWHRLQSTQVRFAPSVFCGCYPRYVFEQIGYFNEDLKRTQDREFNFRLTKAGGRIILDPNIRVIYYPRRTLRSYATWVFVGARWLFSARAFSGTSMILWRNLIPPAFVAYHGLVLATAVFAPALTLGAMAPLLAYYLLCLLLALRIGIERADPLLGAAVLIVFPLTHIAYGLGAICGMLTMAAGRKPSFSDV
jgi:glycosyltransferase involved in cell wall biosynthesis